MRESKIETYLREQVKAIGGIAYKFKSPQNTAVPDRIVLMPHALIYFVEVKSTTGTIEKLQALEHERIRKLDFLVYVLDSLESVNEFITKIKKVQERYVKF